MTLTCRVRMTYLRGEATGTLISHPKEVAEVVMTVVRSCAMQPAHGTNRERTLAWASFLLNCAGRYGR
jgi:hypothetical protein